MPRRISLSLIASVLASLASGPGLSLRAADATLVPFDQYSAAPYRSVGQVELFEPFSWGNFAFGSGVAVGRHVVLSAAHVFYAGDQLGWRQTTVQWFSRRTVMSTAGSQRPRAYRVLAGYADAVTKYSPGEDRSSLEEFNRDAVCLLFYTAAADDITPHAVNAVQRPGGNLLAGYPFELRDGDTVRGRMYRSGGTELRANFRPLGGIAADREGNKNEVYETSDLASGPGGSGGPLFTLIDGEWKVTGILVGGTSNFSAVAVRGVDSELGSMIDNAVTATSPQTPGNEVWTYPIAGASYRIADNDRVVVANSLQITMLDSGGFPLWTTPWNFLGVVDLAVAPNGTIYVRTILDVIAIDGNSGEMRWQYSGRSISGAKLAVGDDSFVYLIDEFDGRNLSALSPAGKLAWKTSLPFGATSVRSKPVIGSDGNIYVPVGDTLYSLRRSDGTVRWQIKPAAKSEIDQMAINAHGTIHTAVDGALLAIAPDDGRILWSTPHNEHLAYIAIQPDGTIAGCSSSGRVYRWTKDGVPLPKIDRPATSLAVGADGKYYLGFGPTMTVTEGDGNVVWSFPGDVTNPILGSQSLLVGTGNFPGVVRAVRTSSGAGLVWSQNGGDPAGTNRAPIVQPLAPVITVQPVAQRVPAGDGLGLSVEAYGSSTLHYQWLRDGTPIAGQNNATLQLAAVTSADAGNYTVEITNPVGTTRSSPASVVIGSVAPGTLAWSKPFAVTGNVVVGRDGVIYVNGTIGGGEFPRGAIFAYGAGGVLLWTSLIEDSTYIANVTSLAAKDSGGLIAFIGGRLTSIADGGKILWQQSLGYAVEGLALGADGRIYLAGFDGLKALSAGGTLLWETKGPRLFNTVVISVDGAIHVSTNDAIVAYDLAGSEIWRSPQPGNSLLLGFDLEGALYANNSGRLLRLDKTGRVLAATTEFGSVSRFATANDGTVYITNGLANGADNKTSALKPAGGTFQVLARHFAGTLAGVTADGLAVMFDGQKTWLANSAGIVVATLSTSSARLVTLTPSGSVVVVGNGVQVIASGRAQTDASWPMSTGSNGNTYRAQAARLPPAVSFATSVISVNAGGPLSLEPIVGGSDLISVTWTKNGQPIAGATGLRLVIPEAAAANAGVYRVTATGANGLNSSATIQVTLAPAVSQAGWYSGNTSAGTPIFAFVDPSGRATLLSESLGSGAPVNATLAANGSFNATSTAVTGTFSAANGSISAGSLTAQLTRVSGTRFILYRGSLLPESENEVCVVEGQDGEIFWWLQSPGVPPTFGNADWDRARARTVDPAGVVVARAEGGGIRGTLRVGSTLRPFFCFGPVSVEESRLVNISSRCYVVINGDPMIAGFVITGAEPQRTLMRAVGPALASFGVAEAPAGTSLRLYAGQQFLADNAAWWQGRDVATVRSESSRLGAFPLPEFGSDSALATALAPGLYSLSIRPVGNRSGVTLAEVYDGGTGSAPLERARLMNISTRATIDMGERALFVGFVVRGSTPLRVLVRAVGPGLGAYNVSGFATDPKFSLFRGDAKIFENDNWPAGDQAVASMRRAEREVAAFPLVRGSNDAAAVLSLEPGLYSVVIAPNDGRSGTALIEIYALPTTSVTPGTD